MKTIGIFLASSIREFEREREQLELFLRNLSDHFETRYHVRIRPVLCENIDPAFTVERKQEEYNRIIRGCNLVFFIFFTKLGEFTYEEFITAKKQFETYGTPKIYTYFKSLSPGESMEQELADFMEKLDHEYGHYHSMFEHLDTIKLRMLLSIQLQEMNFTEVRVENGSCCIGDIPALALDHVAEFRNNESLQKLLNAYTRLEQEYQHCKAQYLANQQDPNICKTYAEVCAKRDTLSQEIQKLQEQILRITLNICDGQVHRSVTPRQKDAYRLFEQGDLEGCMRILDAADIDQEFAAGASLLETLAKDNAAKYICEHMTAIDILSTMIHHSGRYKEIYDRYQKIIPIAKKYVIRSDVFFRYCHFLTDLGRYSEATEFLKELMEFYRVHASEAANRELVQVYIASGDVHTRARFHYEAMRAYQKALKFLNTEKEDDPERWKIAEKVTERLLAIGQTYRKNYIREHGALSYHTSWINLLFRHIQKRAILRLDQAGTKLLEQDPSNENQLFRARVHYNYARFYEKHNNKRCISHYLQALSIAENCKNADGFVEQCLQKIVFFFWLIRPSEAITPYLNRLIQIRENQFQDNPDKYYFALYTVYCIACYQHMKDADQTIFNQYSLRLSQIASTFHDRMNVLADTDPESYLYLYDGRHDWYLLEIADEYPEAVERISGIYHDFTDMI